MDRRNHPSKCPCKNKVDKTTHLFETAERSKNLKENNYLPVAIKPCPPTPADSRGSASEKQLHAASRTRSKCQSADAKAKMFSKSKQGKGESNQAARAGSKQARRRRRGSNYTHQVVHAANVKVPMQKDFFSKFQKRTRTKQSSGTSKKQVRKKQKKNKKL